MRWIVATLLCALFLVACTTTTPKETVDESTTDAVAGEKLKEPPPDKTTVDTTPDKTIADTTPDTTPEPLPETREVVPEPRPEPRPEPQPDKGSDISTGVCKDSSPKCPDGYRCRDDVTPATCQKLCDPNAKVSDCPGGKACLVLQTGEAICVEGTIVKKGEKCDTQNICAQGLVCVLSSGTSGKCYERCTVRDQTCPSGQYCYLLHSFNGVCLAGSGGSKKPGEACTRSDECKTGTICFTPYQRSARCAELCDAKRPCATGFVCADIQGANRGTGACIN